MKFNFNMYKYLIIEVDNDIFRFFSDSRFDFVMKIFF